jgi:hypothetical protein
MKLFEVSAKDDRGSFVHRFPFTIKLSWNFLEWSGVQQLFDSLIAAIIARRSEIRDTEWRRRDSIILKDPETPTWGAVAEEEDRQRELGRSRCCS